MINQVFIVLLGSIFFLFSVQSAVTVAVETELWERWSTHDSGTNASIDHRVWDKFLDKTIR